MNYKIRTKSPEESVRAQSALFALGWEWAAAHATGYFQHTDAQFLTAYDDWRIYFACSPGNGEDADALFESHQNQPISIEELEEMAYGAGAGAVTFSVEAKENPNPKAAFGAARLPLSLWPAIATAYGAIGLLNGKQKYGGGNFKATEVLASIYIDALERHLSAWKNGEEFDPVDGQPHLAGILANVAILLEARAVGTLVDDRQIRGGYLKEREHLTEIAQSIIKFHEGKNPRHYTLADNDLQVNYAK